MTKFKSIILAAMLATAGLTAQTAQAATYDLEYDLVGGFSATATNTYSSAIGAFSDHFLFNLDHTFEAGASVTSSYVKGKDVQITGFNIVQYGTSESDIIKTVYGVNELATNGVGKKDWWTLDTSWLVAGNYYLEVTGNVLGANGGSYSADLNVAAVPEPETYAMLLGGLGLVGFVARRRKATKVAA